MTSRLIPIALALLCCGGGCTTYVVPPPATAGQGGLPVFIADYGYHSTIILPRARGGMVEYAYGDWTYFGLNQKSLSTGLHAMLASDQATLGRRVLDRSPDQSGLEQALAASAIVKFAAPREKVIELEAALERRFSARADSMQYSAVHHLYFVKDDEPYGIGHNCNHFTAQWLERLGCRVEGFVFASKFKLKEAADGPTTLPTGPAPTRLAGNPASKVLGRPERGARAPTTTQSRSQAGAHPVQP